jgi:alkylation response protein AidB-like acyl-CoA dehydrogenase
MTTLLSQFRLARLPAEAEAFRAEVKDFLSTQMPPAPPDIRARSWMGFSAEFSRRMAERGWVGLTLPREYGGASLNAFSRFVLVEELLAAGAPVSAHWIADRQSGPLILKYGTEAQRRFYLPKICAAEAFFCIGMSEPNSGSDLASVGTRAARTENGWRLNGRKIWTTNAKHCQYMIALVRSSGGPEDRHKGLSQFIVDLSLPGVTVRPIRDLTGDAHFS